MGLNLNGAEPKWEILVDKIRYVRVRAKEMKHGLFADESMINPIGAND